MPISLVRLSSVAISPIRSLTREAFPHNLSMRMGRTLTLLSAGWALTLLPVLCTAGVLIHPCECDSPVGCSHESECADDPCNSATLPQTENALRTTEVPVQVPAFLPAEGAGAGLTPHSIALRRSRWPLRWAHRPFPESDIPLLV